MKFLKSITLKWWQGGIFKSAMVSGGIAIALTWPQIVSVIPLAVWWTLSIVLAIYITIIWVRQ